MKRILLTTAIAIGISSIAAAQTSGSNSSNSPSVSSSTAKPKKGKASKSTTASDTLNDRKMYDWKDGQQATPTGHEATGTNGGYAGLGRDSSLATRRDSTKQQR